VTDSLSFIPFKVTPQVTAWIPDDVELRLPEHSSLAPADQHFLISIPWRDEYLVSVDPEFRDFFTFVHPYLQVRTTDVHVATCLKFLPGLVQAVGGKVDRRTAEIAFVLHDSGWSQMTEGEIAHSLGVKGLSLTGDAVDPKARHAVLGADVARKVLTSYPFRPPLSSMQKEQICQAVLYHDKPGELASAGDIPPEMKVVCDTDHFWSFTHPNFWQDTVRKGIPPDVYLRNLGADLEGYFVTASGKKQARELLRERQPGVEAWKALSD